MVAIAIPPPPPEVVQKDQLHGKGTVLQSSPSPLQALKSVGYVRSYLWRGILGCNQVIIQYSKYSLTDIKRVMFPPSVLDLSLSPDATIVPCSVCVRERYDWLYINV